MPENINNKPETKNRKGNKPVPLFYWSSIKFEGQPRENYGDLLSKYLVEKISGRKVKWVHPKKQPWYKLDKTNYLAVGSILPHATKDSIVWGSGIIDRKHQIAEADFRAVRGPQTRKFLLNLGYQCPEIYGDPALLLPLYYQPKVEKKYKVGIIPHYVDYKLVSKMYERNNEVIVIDLLTDNIEATTDEILSCEIIISSSLHGIIVAHAYDIPAVWVKFTNNIFGDGIKYKDYFESVALPNYQPQFIREKVSSENFEYLFRKNPSLPTEEQMKELEEGLKRSFPFK